MFDDLMGSLFGNGGGATTFTPQPTPDPWDPSTEQFWQQVRANQEADAQGRIADRIPIYGLPEAKPNPHILSAYDNPAPLSHDAPSTYGDPIVSPEGIDVRPLEDEFPEDATDVPDEIRKQKVTPVDDGREGYKPGTIGEEVFRTGRVPVIAMANPEARKPRALSVREELRISTAVPTPGGLPNFSGPPRSSGRTWTADPRWRVGLSDFQKAAAMSLLEADTRRGKPDMESARNALGAMLNRAAKTGESLGQHVSRAIYQPTIEPAQWARLNRIIRLPEFAELAQLARDRFDGKVKDWVKGATHFLAHESVMLKLSGGVRPDPYNPGQYVGNSRKYFSWPKWTGFDAKTGSYRGVVFRDKSHAFLIRD